MREYVVRTMKTKIIKVGNSRAVLVPAALANDLGWDVGQQVEIERLTSGLVVHHKPRRSFARALARVIEGQDDTLKRLALR